MEEVERYPNGRIKYKQDYKRRYEDDKDRIKLVTAKVPARLAEEFEAKLALEGSNKNKKIRGWIEGYVYNDDPR